MNDVIIIGAGAAGLMAAVGANGNKVLVLEKMPRAGRKIMITGKGRCNFTNLKEWNEFAEHVHPKANLLKAAFYNLPPEKLISLFNENGLETVVERGDRVFPVSHSSADVVDTLVSMSKKAGAQILYNKEVISINLYPLGKNEAETADPNEMVGKNREALLEGSRQEGKEDCKIFTLKCSDGSEYSAAKLIITTGGLSYPATGSSGDGYSWAREMGLTVKETFPSLTALVPKNYKNSTEKGHIDRSTPLSETGNMLKDIQLKNVSMSLMIDGNTVQEEFGEMAFTDGGIEGPLGFRLSRKAVNALRNGSKTILSMDLKPAVTIEELDKRIASLWREISDDRRNVKKQYKDKIYYLMLKLMPRELIDGFVRTNTELSHKNMAKALKSWKFELAGYVGYERAVITAGGIDSSEIVAKSMECKKIKGLYFAGEILDLDADTGGYNLQIAFSTGFLAGQSASC